MEISSAMSAASDCLQAALDLLKEHNEDEAVAQCRLKVRQSMWWLDRARRKQEKPAPIQEMPLLELGESYAGNAHIV